MTAPAAPTPPTPATPEASGGTDYIIFAKEDVGRWAQKIGITARDAKQAVEKYAESIGNKAGTYVAIADSKWKPLTVTPQTVTTLKLEEAK